MSSCSPQFALREGEITNWICNTWSEFTSVLLSSSCVLVVSVISLCSRRCRGCYGTAIASLSGSSKSIYTLLIPVNSPLVDRVVVAEDQTKGQLIRTFTLTGQLSNGSSVTLSTGSSVGNKYIAVLPQALPLQAVQLNVTSVASLSPSGAPFIRNFAVYGCSALAESLDEAWTADGWV